MILGFYYFTTRYMSERLLSPEVLYKNIYNIHKFETPKLEIIYKCICSRMDKSIVEHSQNRILLSSGYQT